MSTTTSEPTLDQALALARRLSPQDQATLIGQLAQAMIARVAPDRPSGADAWARWSALRDDISRSFPQAQLSARLDADRRERDELRSPVPSVVNCAIPCADD